MATQPLRSPTCSSCGAALKGDASAAVWRCDYCGREAHNAPLAESTLHYTLAARQSAHLELARVEFRAGDYKNAKLRLEEFIQQLPNVPEAWAYLAICHAAEVHSDNYDIPVGKARECLDQAIIGEPDPHIDALVADCHDRLLLATRQCIFNDHRAIHRVNIDVESYRAWGALVACTSLNRALEALSWMVRGSDKRRANLAIATCRFATANHNLVTNATSAVEYARQFIPPEQLHLTRLPDESSESWLEDVGAFFGELLWPRGVVGRTVRVGAAALVPVLIFVILLTSRSS